MRIRKSTKAHCSLKTPSGIGFPSFTERGGIRTPFDFAILYGLRSPGAIGPRRELHSRKIRERWR